MGYICDAQFVRRSGEEAASTNAAQVDSAKGSKRSAPIPAMSPTLKELLIEMATPRPPPAFPLHQELLPRWFMVREALGTSGGVGHVGCRQPPHSGSRSPQRGNSAGC